MSERIDELFEVLATNALDHAGRDELTELLEETQDWDRLTRLYEELASQADSEESALEWYRKAADVAEAGSEDLAKAVELLGNTLMGNDDDIVATLQRMRTMLSALEDWVNWLEVAENEALLQSDPGLAVALYVEMGDTANVQLDEQSRALDYYQEAFERDNTCVGALHKARDICRAQEEWSSLFELYQVELEVTSDAAQSAELLCEMGEVAQSIGADEDAETCFNEALNFVEAYPRALEGLNLSQASEEGENISAQEIAEEGEDTRAEAMLPTDEEVESEVLVSETESSDDSIHAPNQIDDENEESASDESDTLMNVESVDDTSLDHQAQETVQETALNEAQDQENSPEQDTTAEPVLAETTQLPAADTNDDSDAVVTQADDAEEAPSDDKDTVVAEALEPEQMIEESEAERTARLEKVENLIDEASIAEPDQQLSLLLEATNLSRGADAVRVYLLAVNAAPRSLDVYLTSGRQLAVDADEATLVTEALHSLAESDEDNAEVLNAHALVFAGHHYAEARPTDQGLRELLRKGDDDSVRDWQVQRFIESGKWRNAQQLVSEGLDGDPTSVRVEGLKLIAQLAESRAMDVDKAVGFWRQAFQASPDDGEIRQALIRLYPEVGKWKEYGAVLKAELENTPDYDEERRLELVRALIPVAIDHLRQDQLVVSLYQQLLQMDPSDEASRNALATRFEKMRNWPQLVTFYEQQIPELDDGDALEMRLKIADIYLNKMRNQVEAIQAYEGVLDAYPDSEAALSALQTLYEKRRSWDQYVEVRLRSAEAATSDEEKLERLRDLARYAEKKIRRPQLTLQLWQTVLDVDPQDASALESTVSLCEQTKDWQGLIDTVGQMQGAAIDTKVLASCLAKAGSVALERMEDAELSLPFWGALADLEPDNRRVVENYKKALISLGMWDALTDFLGGIDKWTDLVRVLESQSAQQPDLTLQIELLQRAASVYEAQLGQPDKAARTLERILLLDSNDLDALRKLRDHYEGKGDLRKLANVLPSLIDLEEDDQNRLRLQLQQANICQKNLRNPNLALDALRPVFEVDPFYEGALDLLLEVGKQSRQWEPIAHLLSLGADQSDLSVEDEVYARLVLELAAIQANTLKDDQNAIRRYQQVLDRMPQNETALDALEVLFDKNAAWFELLQVIEVRIDMAEDAEQRSNLINRQSTLYESQLNDLPSAVDAQLRIIEEIGLNTERVTALRRLYLQTEQFAQLYGVLTDYVDAVEGDEPLIDIQLELAELAMAHLSDAEGAVEHFRVVLSLKQDHVSARMGLESLMTDPSVRAEAAAVLRGVYETLERWGDLVSALGVLIEEESDDSQKRVLQEQLGQVLTEQLDEPAKALLVYGALLESFSDDSDYLTRLLDLARQVQAWSECTQILERVVGDVDDATTRVGLLRELGSMYENEQHATAMAIDAYRRIIEDEAHDEDALDALARLYFAAEQWPDLLEIYRVQLGQVGTQELRQEKRFQMAQLLEEFLSDPQAAIDLYLEVLEDDGENARALQSLARLFAFEEMWAELADILVTQISVAQDDDTVRNYRLDLAEVRELRLSETDSALEIYQEILELDPENERVRHALERLLGDSNVKALAAQLLEPVYTRREDWRGLVSCLNILQETVEEPSERITYLLRIVDAQDTSLDSPGEAFHTLVHAMSIDPTRDDVLVQLKTLAERLSLWSELVGHLENVVGDLLDPERGSRLCVEMGLIQRDHLGDLGLARNYFVQALVRDETNIDAFTHLDALLTAATDYESLTALLLQRAEVEAEEQIAIQRRLRAARLLESDLEQPSQAIDVYQQVLVDQEINEQAIESLERLYRVTERWQDYLDLLESKCERLDDEAQKRPILFQMAETYERELNDLNGAVAAYESILEHAPDAMNALRRLDTLYELLEQWDEQLSVLQRQVVLIDEPDVQINLKFRIAHLRDVRLLELEEALEGYREVLEQDGAHEQCLSRLEGWVRENREPRGALEVLVPRLESLNAWHRLIATYEELLGHLDILDERIETNQLIANLHEVRLEEPQQAFQVLGRALQEDMTREDLLDELERLSNGLENWPTLVTLLEDCLSRIPNAFAAKDLNGRLARLSESHLGDDQTAINYHRQVLEVEPDSETTLDALDRLYNRTEDWASLASILEQRAQFADDGPRESFLFRLGSVCVARLDDHVRAINCFEQVLEITPTHEEVIAALEQLFEQTEKRFEVGRLLENAYIEAEDYRKLHDLNAQLVYETDDDNQRLNLFVSLAELAEAKLEEEPSAYRWYAEAFVLQPLDEDLRVQAESYAGKLDRYEDWVTRLEQAIQHCEDEIRRQDLAIEVGVVEYSKLRRIDRAEAAMRRVIETLDPVNPKALEVLDEIYHQTDQDDLLINILRVRSDVLVEEEDRIRVKLRLAKLLTAAELLDEALKTYEESVELDPTTREALTALASIYEVREMWNELLDVLQKQTQIAEAGGAQGVVFAQMARLASERLQRPEEAIEYWGEVLRLQGEDHEALTALELLYTQTESWRDLVDVLERQVTLSQGDVTRERSLYEKLGRIWGNELDREEKAIDNWNKVRELAPQDSEPKWALLELYERSDRFDDYLEVGQALLESLTPASEAEQTLSRKMARVATDELKAPEKGIKYWARVASARPEDEEALLSLEELYTAVEDWRNCAVILQKRARIGTDQFEQIANWFRVSEVAGEKLEDAELFQLALVNVLELDAQNLDAMQQLEDSYHECGMWEEKAGLLLQRLELSADVYEQGDLFEAIAALFEEKLGSLESAFEVYLQAFEATKDEERFGIQLARLADTPDQWSQLVQMYEQILSGMGAGLDSVDMRLKTAKWSLDKLADTDRSANLFESVLGIDPSNLEALVQLQNILEERQSWVSLATIMERRIELEDNESVMKGLSLQLADIYDGRLGREADAVVWYRRALDFDPENLDILAALEGALTVQMNWTELVDVFERQIEYSEDEASKREKQLALAELFENQLSDPDRAIAVYQEMAESGAHRRDVLMPMKRLLVSQQRWYELIDLYPSLAAILSEVEDLTDLYSEWAEVQMDQLGDVDGAIETLRTLFELIPDNVDTVAVLDELYRQAHRYDELADLYALHLSALTDPAVIETAATALAILHTEKLEESSRAREVLEGIIGSLHPTSTAHEMLLSLCEADADHGRCAELLELQIPAISDEELRISRQSQLAGLYLNSLDNAAKAEVIYREILSERPQHLDALRALAIFALRSENWTEAIQLNELVESHAKTLEDKSRALFQIGQIYSENLGELETAMEYFEQAADVWPENQGAADILIKHYFENENWIRLDPLLRAYLARESDKDEAIFFRRCKQMAKCAEMLSDEQTAIEYIRLALEHDRTDLDALRQCGRLLLSVENYGDAATNYLTILAHHRDDLDASQAADIYQQLGRIKGKQGEMRKALDFFRKALDVDPDSLETQRALVELHADRGDWNDVVHYQRQLLESLSDATDRFEVYIALSEVYDQNLGQTRLAIESLEEARALDPQSRIVLGKLMELHEKAQDWGALVQVLQHLAENETDQQRKAKLWCAIAVHQQQSLDDRFTAVRSFDKALDCDPTYLEAFEAIANILNQDRDYARQDRYYRKMLKRALENRLDDGLVFTLGKGLGEINRTRLKNYSEAIKAYKIALARKPDDVATHQILAQLYELEDDAEAAIKQYSRLLNFDPRNVETYRNMKKLFLEIGRFDEAWCVCQALCFLQVANEEEKGFFEKRRARSLKGSAQLTPQQWGLLSHPSKSGLLDQLLSSLYPILMPAMARNLKDFGLHRKKSVVDPRTEMPVNVVLAHVNRLTGLDRPTIYQGMDKVVGVLNINTNPPAIAVGEQALQPKSVQALCFSMSRASLLSAQPYLLASFPEDTDYKARQVRVKKTLYSLMKVINPSSQAQHDAGLVELFSTQIPQESLASLNSLLAQMSKEPQTHLDATRWLDGVELTADRLGLLCANDLNQAVFAMKNNPYSIGKLEMSEKIKELIVYSVSPEYLALRAALGIAQ